jgi:hypothetical protein
MLRTYITEEDAVHEKHERHEKKEGGEFDTACYQIQGAVFEMYRVEHFVFFVDNGL